MYCRFPKGYFFEVEKESDLINYEELEVEYRKEEDIEITSESDLFELELGEDERCKKNKCDEKHDNKCSDHKCHDHECNEKKYDEKKKEHTEKCSHKHKCKEEGKFFECADNDYLKDLEKKHEANCHCKCNYKK